MCSAGLLAGAAERRGFGDPDTLVANVNTPDESRSLGAHQGHSRQAGAPDWSAARAAKSD
jgi:hypothetical protein